MSLTAATWVLLATGLIFLSLQRPVFAAALYFQTFFAFPKLWWWGRQIPHFRYALWAGIILIIAVLLYNSRTVRDDGHRRTDVHWMSIAMIVNATIVHLLFAVGPVYSLDTYIELIKYVLLFFLLWMAIRDRNDFRIALVAIAVGAMYIGWEVTINERGDFQASRLEGVGTPSADTANGLAAVMLMCVPLIGSLIVIGTNAQKVLALAAAPLVLNVVLLCNSRGAFLGLVGAGAAFIVLARGPTRKRALQVVVLGSILLYMLLGDPEILQRFTTTFAGSEERDNSATGRLQYWHSAIVMLADYPVGAGGGGFKHVLGRQYARDVVGRDEAHSIHNGYLTEATDWGIQGLFFKLWFLFAAGVAARRTLAICQKERRVEDALLGMCLIASAVALLIVTVFGSFLANEWNYWMAAFLVRYSELYKTGNAQEAGSMLTASSRTAEEHVTG